MAGKESTQHWLDRNRPPRVQITYDVETGGASEKKELPMVMGIMADLSGNHPSTKRPKMKERKFVEIDRDNLNAVMKQISPRVELKIEGKEAVDLTLESMEDFSPATLVRKVPALDQLFQRRSALNDLLAKLDGNDDLEERLKEVIKEQKVLDELKSELETEKAKLLPASTDPA
jgi:type VI secretion system protein ImpB